MILMGFRPGEKTSEDLRTDGEDLSGARHRRILKPWGRSGGRKRAILAGRTQV